MAFNVFACVFSVCFCANGIHNPPLNTFSYYMRDPPLNVCTTRSDDTQTVTADRCLGPSALHLRLKNTTDTKALANLALSLLLNPDIQLSKPFRALHHFSCVLFQTPRSTAR